MRCASGPGAGRQEQHQDRDRQQRGARGDRAEAGDDLQGHDQHEEDAGERRVDGERDDVRRGERPVREHRQRQHRHARALSVHTKRPIATTPTSRVPDTAASPGRCAGHAMSPNVSPARPDGGEHRAGSVDVVGRPAGRADSGTCRTASITTTAASGRFSTNTQRQPAVSTSQPPSEGPDRAGDADEARPGADRPGAVLRPEGRLQDGEAAGGQQRAADALQGAGQHEGHERGGDGAEQRGGREPARRRRRRPGGGRTGRRASRRAG